MEITIRNEEARDFRKVEELTKKAFCNIHEPGCTEHYLVHTIIMYVKSKLIDEDGNEKNILTFGPLSVLPEYQRNGFGKSCLNIHFRKHWS